MFRNRDRPTGLEFPSCEPCNNGARRSDRIAAFMGRLTPDPQDENEQDEMLDLLLGINADIPGIAFEFQSSRAHERRTLRQHGRTNGEGILLGGPIVGAHMEAFAARLGFALHFHATGKAIPALGGVAVRVFTNVDLLNDLVPSAVFEQLGPPTTLRQGVKEVGKQFAYAVSRTDDSTLSMSYAVFRESFSILAFAAADRLVLKDGLKIHTPGDPIAAPLLSGGYGTRLVAPWPSQSW